MSKRKFDLRGKSAVERAHMLPATAKKEAEAAFRKKAQDAAMSDYQKAQKAVQKKLDRLRELRLTKEAAERGEADRAAEIRSQPALRTKETKAPTSPR